MFRQTRFLFLTVTLLLVMFVSMARPMAVYADDSTPPAPTEEPVEPPAEEAPVVNESAPSPEPTAEVSSEPAATETPTEPAAEEPEPVVVAEILEAAPEGTEVVVLDENSEVIPLVSQEAAQIVATTDPVWCPAGQNPGNDLDDSIQDCSDAFLTPADLIADINASNPKTPGLGLYEADGTIFFTADPGGAFILNASSLENADYNAIKLYNLTLQGGWNGGTGAGFSISGQTDFGANRVQIGSNFNPWAGNVTINNLSFNGVSNGSGLMVSAAGAITLNSVTSENNTGTTGTAGHGVYLNNTSGSADITVQNSTFSNNGQNGLQVLSDGNITLNNVVSQNNTENGANLNNDTGTGNINITSSTFSGNTERGLIAASNGNITLAGVVVQGNGDRGADLDNCRPDLGGVCMGTGHVQVSSSVFSGNGGPGLVVDSTGNIVLASVSANENVHSGAQLHNEYSGESTINISSSTFNANGVNGLEASSSGDITLDGVVANGNVEIGASINNAGEGEGNVTISNSNFDSNTSTGREAGLEVNSSGTVTLNGVSASNNLAGNGASIVAGSLVIEDSTFNNNASSNRTYGHGLLAQAETAEIICSQFSNNDKYGLEGSLVGFLSLNDVVFGGNGSGDYLGSPVFTTGSCVPDDGGEEEPGEPGPGEPGPGEPGPGGPVSTGGTVPLSSNPLQIIPLTGLSLHIVPVSGDENVTLDCGAFSGTKLVLPNGDSVILPCPIRDEGSLVAQAQAALPGLLDEQFTYISGLKTDVIRDGKTVATVDPSLIVEFVIPDGQNTDDLAVLHWNGSEWVEFPGQITSDGYFAVTTNFTGIFVLVTK